MPPPTITPTPISATAMASQVPRRIVSPSNSQPSTAVSSGEALSMKTALATVVCMSAKMKPQKPVPSSAPASTASPPARRIVPQDTAAIAPQQDRQHRERHRARAHEQDLPGAGFLHAAHRSPPRLHSTPAAMTMTTPRR